MANPLNRNLRAGTKLVMRNGAHVEIGTELFGSFHFTAGTALSVKDGRETVRCDAYDIDAEATMRVYGKQNGWIKDTEPATGVN